MAQILDFAAGKQSRLEQQQDSTMATGMISIVRIDPADLGEQAQEFLENLVGMIQEFIEHNHDESDQEQQQD